MRGVRQRWELDIIGGGNRLRRGSEGGRGRGEGRYKARRRRRRKGWRTTRKSREELTQSEGEVKEESRRRGGRGRASMWLKRNEEDGRREGLASQGQKKKARRGTRRQRERGREREKKSTRTQEVWRSPFTCQVIRWCVHTPEMSQPNAPRSLQITATDNKQLFTCWTRVGVETKVFCQRSKRAWEQMCASIQKKKKSLESLEYAPSSFFFWNNLFI